MLTDKQIRRMLDVYYGELPGTLAETTPFDIAELCTRVLASEARVKVLEDALRPFAKAADNFDGILRESANPNEWFAYPGQSDHQGTIGAITVANLRRARKALEEAPKDLL